MSIAPHSGIIDFGVFTPPTVGLDGIQGEVPAPLAAELGYVLTASGWAEGGSIAGLGTMAQQDADDVSITGGDIAGTRVEPRTNSQATIASSYAFNSNSFDVLAVNSLQNDTTISADAGAPSDGAKLVLRFKDNGSSRVITFTGGSSKTFLPVGVTLTPSGSNFTYATLPGKLVYFGCIYNSNSSRWDIIALSQEA